MAAQQGPGTNPRHTLYDEDGFEVPIEGQNQDEQDSDGDGSPEEVEDVTVRNRRQERKSQAKRESSESTPGGKRRKKSRSTGSAFAAGISSGPPTGPRNLLRRQQVVPRGRPPAGAVDAAYEAQFGKTMANEARMRIHHPTVIRAMEEMIAQMS